MIPVEKYNLTQFKLGNSTHLDKKNEKLKEFITGK